MRTSYYSDCFSYEVQKKKTKDIHINHIREYFKYIYLSAVDFLGRNFITVADNNKFEFV